MDDANNTQANEDITIWPEERVVEKKVFVEQLATELRISRTDARRIVEAMIKVFFENLANGKEIIFRDLFSMKFTGWLQKKPGKLAGDVPYEVYKLEVKAGKALKNAAEDRGKVYIPEKFETEYDPYESWNSDDAMIKRLVTRNHRKEQKSARKKK